MRKRKKSAPTLNQNARKRWSKIQDQFKTRINERNHRGERPNLDDVIGNLADDWGLTKKRIEEIIRMKL